jgi:hypothetical protein
LVASVSKRSGGFAARHPISDGSAFNELKKLVDSEGANLAGPDWLGMLAAIGIIKGQPFTPDAHSREILNQAAKTGYKTSRVIGFQEVVSGRSLRVYSDRRWLNPFADGTHADPTGVLNLAWENVAGGYLDLDPGSGCSPTITRPAPGWCRKIRARAPCMWSGSPTTRARPWWAAATIAWVCRPASPPPTSGRWRLYEAENASGLANGQPFPSLGSRDKPAQNADGSTDLYLGPKAPNGKEGNWLATVPGRGYFAILRLYGPTEAALNKGWKPGDIEKVKWLSSRRFRPGNMRLQRTALRRRR